MGLKENYDRGVLIGSELIEETTLIAQNYDSVIYFRNNHHSTGFRNRNRKRKRNPSYFQRQRLRREAFLQKRDLTGGNLVGGVLAETVENIQDREGVKRLACGPLKRMNLRK